MAGRPLTPAADVYSLGVVGYELFSGRRPFGGEHPAAVLRAHLEAPPAPLTELPGPLWDLLARCLAKDPADRPEAEQAGQELQRLAPILAGRPPLGAAPDHPPRPPVGAAPESPVPPPSPGAVPVHEPASGTAAFVSPVRPPARPRLSARSRPAGFPAGPCGRRWPA